MGLSLDLDKAFSLYFQAAKAGHVSSCYRTAMSCEIGIGTKRDPQKAMQFYRKAASLGDVASMYKLGTFLRQNELTSRNNYVERTIGITGEYKGSNNMA